MDSELKKLEEELQQLSPRSMEEDVVARMMAAMENWQDHEAAQVVETSSVASEDESKKSDGKVISFPSKEPSKVRRVWRPVWAAAAAFALGGAFLGLMGPGDSSEIQMVEAGFGSIPVFTQTSLTPVTVEKKVDQVYRGFYLAEDGRQYKVTLVEEQNEAAVSGPGERQLKVSKPKMTIYLAPVSY